MLTPATEPHSVPPAPEALIERLLAQADGEPPPGGSALTAKLAKGTAPPAAWSRLAHALHAEWLKGRDQPTADRQDIFLGAVLHAWQDQSETERLHSGLYPAFIRALGARGHADMLCHLVDRVAPLAGREDAEHTLAALLRQLRQHRCHDALRRLLVTLRADWHAERAWGQPLLAGVLALAREAEDFATLQAAADWLPALLQATGADDTSWRELGKLALRTLQVEAMQQVARALLDNGGMANAELSALLLQLLAQLVAFAPDPITRTLLADAAIQAPHHPTLQLAQARLAHADGAELSDIDALLVNLDETHPTWAQATSWWAGVRFHGGDDPGALALYQRLAERQSLGAADRLRLSHLSARDDRADGNAVPNAPHDIPQDASHDVAHATAHTGKPGTEPDAEHAPVPEAHTAWPPEVVGPFADALAPLIGLLNHPPNHDAADTAADLAEAGRTACEAWRATLPTLPAISLQACVQLARHLSQLESSAFASHTQWRIAFPFTLGPAYGRIDAERCRALGEAVLRHLITLSEFALQRPRALQSPTVQANLRQVLDLAEMGCEARWALGEAEAALADVRTLQARLGRLGDVPLRELLARCLLTLGSLAEVPALLATSAGVPSENEVLPLLAWHEWLAAERLRPQTLVDDPALHGVFEAVPPDGGVLRHSHLVAPVLFSVLHHTGLRVRNSHLLIGPLGGILRPGPWHLSMGDYPYEHRHVRLRGGGADAAGAVLRPARWQRVNTPVVVLANMDATYHRNYYHWITLILTRIDALRARGLLLDGRKLLLPREMSGWMRASLAAIGIEDDQVLPYGADDDLQLTDALLASPIDFASPSLIEGLRQTLWRHAGLDPAAPPPATRLLYISRRGEGRRPLVEEARIQQAAEALGFEVVAPETLTLDEQVRLFATARGIAGPPGAAYTNLIWAGAGARVLSIFKEEANLPTFIDLSIVRGQSHRWLLGRNLPGYALMSVVNAPFSVDVGLAERELAWAAGSGQDQPS